MTAGVSGKGIAFTFAAIRAVRNFDTFTPDNDPYGEHDFGVVEVSGSKLFWKIDCYDLNLEYASEELENPDVTIRVLTIMLASEY